MGLEQCTYHVFFHSWGKIIRLGPDHVILATYRQERPDDKSPLDVITTYTGDSIADVLDSQQFFENTTAIFPDEGGE